jgi:hypothetical protein
MDTRYDVEFRVGTPQNSNHSYVRDILIGDINNDGLDDVLISGRLVGPDYLAIDYWDLFLGNAEARADVPDRVIRSDQGWAPFVGLVAIMDINGDGCDDILDIAQHKELGDALLYRGRTELQEFILPDDSIPNLNPDPMQDLSPQKVCPVGDMNGDGTLDLVMAWNTYFCPGCSGYYFYPGGSQFRTPLGYFGTIPEKDFVEPGVLPVGDVNGDGYDDIVTLGHGRTSGRSNRLQIWLGARELQTATGMPPSPGAFDLEISPNPVPVGTHVVRVAAHGLAPGVCHLEVTDFLGRIRLRDSRDAVNPDTTFTLTLDGLEAGVYFISLRQGARRKEHTLIMY